MNAITLYPVHQTWETPQVDDVAGETTRQVDALLERSVWKPGERVGLAVGSRGIAELSTIVASIVRSLKARGLEPVLLPAMGSHGGATPEGQTEVLKKLGIDADALGMAIDADMTTEQLGITDDGTPIHFASSALAVDHILLCNRVKPHTRFVGSTQSGLLKMLVIGLGKQTGAATWHRATHHHSFDDLVSTAVDKICGRVSVLGGLAILENARDEVAALQAVTMSELLTAEPRLLQQAENLMARLPLREIDLLIVDELGKEISGTGMDTNVVGRKRNDHVSSPEDWCRTELIYVRGLTAATAGNANGIGMAEFVRADVLPLIDWRKTAINAITAGHPTAAMCPVAQASDWEVLDAAISILGPELRLVHIQNTLQLSSLLVSQSCLSQLSESDQLTVGPGKELQFDDTGNFTHFPKNQDQFA